MTTLDDNTDGNDQTAAVEKPKPKAAGNCVGRLCAYERALTEEYPEGIEEDSDTLPDPAGAAKRVGDFLRSYGDARVCVAITPLADYQIPPLYGRDLQALVNAAAGWQAASEAPEHVLLLREAAQALKDVGSAALVVKPVLDKPFSDMPNTSPWKRFMEHPARRAYNLGGDIRALVGPAPSGPPDDPWGPPLTGWRTAPDCARCKDTGRYQEAARGGGPTFGGPCQCKRGRRMSELWFAEKHDLHHPDMPEPEPPEEGAP